MFTVSMANAKVCQVVYGGTRRLKTGCSMYSTIWEYAFSPSRFWQSSTTMQIAWIESSTRS